MSHPSRFAVLDRRRKLALVKTAHTAIWFSVEAAVVYLLYTGIAKESRGVRIAAGIRSAVRAIS